MWNPFKKKPKERKKIKERSIEYNKKYFEVGVSKVLIELQDGTRLYQNIEGHIDQYVSGYDYVAEAGVTNSKEAAELFINNLPNQQVFYNYEDRTKGYYSKPVKAEILFTEAFTKTFSEAFLVPEERYED